MVKKKFDAFFFLGWAAVIVVAFDIFANWGDWYELLWFCSMTTALLAYSLFTKNALIMTICLVLSVPAQSMWIVDYVLYFFGQGMGRTALLAQCGPLIFWGSILIHTFMVPVSFWGVYRLGFHRYALGWALLYGFVLLTASYFWTPLVKNVNCVFYSCDGWDLGGGYRAYFLTQTIFPRFLSVSVVYVLFRVLFMKRSFEAVNAVHT